MALNKRKVLDAARKHAQKGAKAKALKEYDKLLKADPRDAKLLLEVGDAYRRWGQAEDAIAQYSKVAAQYRQDGFDARAVAVFKQMLNLDPKQYGAYVSLSELYQRMGLDSEAAAALQMAADGYHKEGRKTEALDLLRQMGALDPSNTTSRTKVAELLRQEGMEDDALAEYEAIAAELANQQDRDQLIVIQERILEISPNHVQTLTSLARTLMGMGDLNRAEPYAARGAAAAPEPPQFELLIDLYAQMGNDEGLSNATRGLAKIYRERGDEDKARELMQRLSTEDIGAQSGARLAVDMSEVQEPDLGDDDLLEDEPFLTLDDEDGSASFGTDDISGGGSESAALDFGDIEIDSSETASSAPADAAASAPVPEGDPDQLLAEASVYLRYGKRDQALRSLETVLAINPDHRGALEKLGECHADGGDNSEAVQTWLCAADLARADGDAETVERLRTLIAGLDPEVAASVESSGAADDSMPSISGVGTDITDTAAAGPELDLDLDLDLDDAIDEVAESDTQTAQGGAPPIEIELDDDSIVFDEPPQTDVDVAEQTNPGFEFDASADDEGLAFDEDTAGAEDDDDDSIDFEIDVDLDDFEDDDEDADAQAAQAEPDASAAAEEVAAPVATMDETQIGEELEEAEFYIAQDMFDEAEAIVARVLESSPGHAAALIMSGEIAAGRGVEDEETSESVTEQAPEEGEALDLGADEEATSEASETLATDASAPEDEDSFEVEMDVDLELSVDSDTDENADLEAETDPVFSEDANDALQEALAAAEDRVEEDEASDPDEVAFELDLDDAGDDDADDALGDTDETTIAVEAEAMAEAPTEDHALEAASATEDSAEAISADFESFDDISSDDADDAETEVDVPVETQTMLEDVDLADLTQDEDELAAQAAEDAAAEAVEDAGDAETVPDVDAATSEAPADDGESFDLREALSDVLDDDPEVEAGVAASEAGLSTIEDGFGSIFSDFKKGVTETLDEGDYDTRYDLGIAYREMGLFDDAIGEFRICIDSPDRQFDSLYLMGLCARDLGRWEDAINHLEQALALPEIPEERLAGVFFDLSMAHEGAGDLERAASTLRRVIELEPNFPGAAERLAALEAGTTSMPELGQPGEVYESFDDLFDSEEADEGGDVAFTEAVREEAFESLDDVIDVSDELIEVVEGEDDTDRAASPDETPGKKSGRRKISFV